MEGATWLWQTLETSILRLYKQVKPLSFVLVLHRAFLLTIWLNLNWENEASLAEAIFNNAQVYLEVLIQFQYG